MQNLANSLGRILEHTLGKFMYERTTLQSHYQETLLSDF
jgi:hypothetical protein